MSTTIWKGALTMKAAPKAPFQEETTDKHWRDDAACIGQYDLFHPDGATGPYLLQIQRAKEVCAGCPVLARCFEWALETGDDFGILAGTTADERRTMKRRVARDRQSAARKAAEAA